MIGTSLQAIWEFFGTELKRRREDAGLTQVELGALVFISGAYIGQFEQAIRKPQLDIAQRIDKALGTDGIFERLCRKLINDRRYADYFVEVVELERLATRICEFAPTVVPGLLQTPEYARAVTLAANPFVTDERGGSACIDERHAPAHGLRGRASGRLYGDVVLGDVDGRSGCGEACTACIRSTQGRRAVFGGVPGPDRVDG